MKDCSFEISISQDPDQVMRMAREAINGAGGKFTSEGESGEFTLSAGIGNIKGSVNVKGSTLLVRIIHKPVFLSCGRIEKAIRKYLGR